MGGLMFSLITLPFFVCGEILYPLHDRYLGIGAGLLGNSIFHLGFMGFEFFTAVVL
jgi:hypothetical protein